MEVHTKNNMSEQQSNNIKGIQIGLTSYILVAITCILYILIIFTTISVSRHYNALAKNMSTFSICRQAVNTVEEASDYLTEQVHLYVITADSKYMDAYMDELYVTRRRESSFEILENSDINEEALSHLKYALQKSDDLTAVEFYAMRLVAEASSRTVKSLPDVIKNTVLTAEDAALSPEDKLQKAQILIIDSDYLYGKEQIRESISSCLNSIMSTSFQTPDINLASIRQSLFRQRIYISALFLLDVIVFAMMMLLVIRPIKTYINYIKKETMLPEIGSRELKHLAHTYNNVYKLNRVNETMLRQKAEQDPLTGLSNRRAFEHLRLVLRNDIPLTLFLIDIDHFKDVNDTYGHDVGDQVLIKVANALQHSFRSQDFVMRIGGDEFATVMTQVTLEQRSVLDQKVNTINEFLSLGKDDLPKVTLSIGAVYSDKGFTEDLYVQADKALYHVKEAGRNGYALYQDIFNSSAK